MSTDNEPDRPRQEYLWGSPEDDHDEFEDAPDGDEYDADDSNEDFDTGYEEYLQRREKYAREQAWKRDKFMLRLAVSVWLGGTGWLIVSTLEDPTSTADWLASVLNAVIATTPPALIYIPVWLVMLRLDPPYWVLFAVSSVTLFCTAMISQVMFFFTFHYAFDIVDALEYGVIGLALPLVHLITTRILTRE